MADGLDLDPDDARACGMRHVVIVATCRGAFLLRERSGLAVR